MRYKDTHYNQQIMNDDVQSVIRNIHLNKQIHVHVMFMYWIIEVKIVKFK